MKKVTTLTCIVAAALSFSTNTHARQATNYNVENAVVVDNAKFINVNNEEGNTESDKYPGKLTIDMMGSPLTEDPIDANVEILYTSDTECTLTLPDFTLDLGGGPVNLGNIVVPNVKVTTLDNVANYTGSVEGMSLLDNQIIADVTVNGTIDSQGNADFKINVMWSGIPIDVSFTGKGNPGKGTNGISNVEMDENSPKEYFTIQGVKVEPTNLTTGTYIIRQGKKVYKEVVR